MLKSNLLLIVLISWASQGFTQSGGPGPGYYIGIAPAEDRWVTLPMGAVYQGVEISYLLGQKLSESGKFIPVYIDPPPVAVTQAPLAAPQNYVPQLSSNITSSEASALERQAQIPSAWTSWLQDSRFATQQEPLYSLRVQPVVETLIYSSGDRSDRSVYGFSPDHTNLFNQGRAGALDNTYVASFDQTQNCQKADFFNGQLNPYGYGPFSSNYGANFDQGVNFNILGQGFAFILKKFQISDQIRFLIDDLNLGTHEELVFNTTAKGSDVYVWGSYQNISGSIDIQTRTTMIAALQKLLPQVVDDLIGQKFSGPWETSITSISGEITIGAGLNQNVQQGQQLASANGNIFEVQFTGPQSASVIQISGSAPVEVGDLLQAYFGKPLVWAAPTPPPAPSQLQGPLLVQGAGARALASVSTNNTSAQGANQVQIFSSQKTVILDQTTRAAEQVAAVAACVDKKPDIIEQTLDSLFIPYGFYRYAEVFDQAPKAPKVTPSSTPPPNLDLPPSPGASNGLRIAIIDSGIDFKDSKIKSHLSFSNQNIYEGFDFISWDSRPSDDNGHGTAAAKLLLSLVKNKKVSFLSTKVIGSQGETSSSAIYDGFTFAVKSQVDAIVVPWSSIPSTLDAYILGAQFAADSNIPVFVAPGTVPAQSNIYVGTLGTKSFKTSGLEAKVKLPPEGVAAIQALANWINSKK